MHDNNLFADIKKLLTEDHSKEEIKALSTSELKKLHGEYLAKGTDEAKKEAAEIKKEIDSRGEDGEDLNEAKKKDWRYNFAQAAKKLAKKKAEAEKKKSETEKPVAEQNEELLAILDTLCEMAGLDMETLIEQMTRKDWQNLGHASGWDQRAPADAPHGSVAANARMRMVMAGRERGTRSQREAAAARADAIPTGEETAHKLEMSGKDRLHEPTAARRARGAPAVEYNTRAFDSIQDFIERSADAFTRERMKNNAFNAMKPFALQPKPKGKGKEKK